MKVIGRLPGEYSCTSLVWAVLDRAAAGWRGFTVTPDSLRLLQQLRTERITRQAAPAEAEHEEAVTAPEPAGRGA